MKQSQCGIVLTFLLGLALLASPSVTAQMLPDAGASAKDLVRQMVLDSSVRVLRGKTLLIADVITSSGDDRMLAEFADDVRVSLQTALIRSGLFQVIERSQLQGVLKQLKLDLPDLTKPEVARHVGKLLNADLILFGAVTRTGNRNRVSVRLVNSATGWQCTPWTP